MRSEVTVRKTLRIRATGLYCGNTHSGECNQSLEERLPTKTLGLTGTLHRLWSSRWMWRWVGQEHLGALALAAIHPMKRATMRMCHRLHLLPLAKLHQTTSCKTAPGFSRVACQQQQPATRWLTTTCA